MKNLKLLTICGLLAFSSCEKSTTSTTSNENARTESTENAVSAVENTTVVALGDALYAHFQALQEVNSADYCFMQATLDNENLTDAEKVTQLETKPALSNLIEKMNAMKDVAVAHNASAFLNDLENQDQLGRYFEDRIHPIQDGGGGPCDAWNAQRVVNGGEYSACMMGVAIGCTGANIAYIPCAAVGAAICITIYMGNIATNNANHPDCVPASYANGEEFGNITTHYNPDYTCD